MQETRHAGTGGTTWLVVPPTWLLKNPVIGTVSPRNGPEGTKKGRSDAAPVLQ